jgi:hypothetical protein
MSCGLSSLVPAVARVHNVLEMLLLFKLSGRVSTRRDKHSTSDAVICTPAVARAHNVLEMSCGFNSLAVSARRDKHSTSDARICTVT